MTDIDQQIRRELTHRANQAAPPPAAEALLVRVAALEKHNPGRPLRYGIVAVAATTLVVGAALVDVNRGDRIDTTAGNATLAHVDIDGDGAAELALGDPVALALPTPAESARQFAISGTTLITASTTQLDGPVTVTTLSLNGSAPVAAVSDGPAGMALALAAVGDRVVVVVSRHGLELPPVLLVSEDGGRQWVEQELAQPEGVSGQDAFASGVALAPGRIVVVGSQGVWTSDGAGDWGWTAIAEGHDQLHDIAWDGTSFLISGSRPDSSVTSPGGDSDPAFWRSADGITWTGPETAELDPDLRTSDGAGPIVAGPDGITLSVAPAQSWSRSMEWAGTVVAVSTGGQRFTTRFVPGWSFQTVLATDWGFLTAAHSLTEPAEFRFLASAEGLEWTDLGPAPGAMLSGSTWGRGLVINGYRTDGSLTGTWFLPPLDPAGMELSPTATLPVDNAGTADPSVGGPAGGVMSTVPAAPNGTDRRPPSSDTTTP